MRFFTLLPFLGLAVAAPYGQAPCHSASGLQATAPAITESESFCATRVVTITETLVVGGCQASTTLEPEVTETATPTITRVQVPGPSFSAETTLEAETTSTIDDEDCETETETEPGFKVTGPGEETTFFPTATDTDVTASAEETSDAPTPTTDCHTDSSSRVQATGPTFTDEVSSTATTSTVETTEPV